MLPRTGELAAAVFLIVAAASAPDASAKSGPKALAKLVPQIMKADYEGDRAALDRLYVEVDRFLADPSTESRARYWKGYTKWRRAMNGANETPTPTDLADDSVRCVDEMRKSSTADPAFVDAAIGEMACLGLVLFFDRERAGNDERIARLRAIAGDLKTKAADNPRYTWAWGMAMFNAPTDRGGGPDNVIKAYLEALDGAKRGAGKPKSALDPAWGEAELNVNLAYSYLNKPDSDWRTAKSYVDEAIRLAPNWHYAKDILRPQIEQAISKQAAP
jgi:hypothetical protein